MTDKKPTNGIDFGIQRLSAEIIRLQLQLRDTALMLVLTRRGETPESAIASKRLVFRDFQPTDEYPLGRFEIWDLVDNVKLWPDDKLMQEELKEPL